MGNFVKATFAAISSTYAYLTPDLWKETRLISTPFQQFSDFLSLTGGKNAVKKVERLE